MENMPNPNDPSVDNIEMTATSQSEATNQQEVLEPPREKQQKLGAAAIEAVKNALGNVAEQLKELKNKLSNNTYVQRMITGATMVAVSVLMVANLTTTNINQTEGATVERPTYSAATSTNTERGSDMQIGNETYVIEESATEKSPAGSTFEIPEHDTRSEMGDELPEDVGGVSVPNEFDPQEAIEDVSFDDVIKDLFGPDSWPAQPQAQPQAQPPVQPPSMPVR